MHGPSPQAPDPRLMPPSWYDVTSVPGSQRPRLDYVAEADACIVGAGLAGLTLARELAGHGWSVVVLEAQAIAAGPSGRHGGFVLPGFALDQDTMERRIGFDRAKALYDLSRLGVEQVRRTIEDLRMPGVAIEPGMLNLVRSGSNVDRFRARSEQFIRRYGPGPLFWPRERIREVLRSDRYQAGLYDGSGFHIHALNYALGLAADAVRHGVRIFEMSPATGFDMRSIRRIVSTPQGAVRCNRIILCGGASLAPSLHGRAVSSAIPIYSHVGVTAPLGDALADAVRFRGGLLDVRLGGDYFRVVEGGRLLWGGGVSLMPRRPKAIARAIARNIAAAFPQLRGVAVEHAWSGAMAYAPHRMPVIAEIERDLYLLAGFGGHGVNTSAVAATILAETLANHGKAHQHFARFGLQPSRGTLGRLAARLRQWRRSAREHDGDEGWR